MVLPVCQQPRTLGEMGKGYRWFVFLVGMLESMIWGATIFGWASLVYVLKARGVYRDLCIHPSPPNNTVDSAPTSTLFQDMSVRGCVAQDEMFALIYAMSCMIYSLNSIVVGFALHHLGLAVTRVTGGIMVSAGFILLSFTSAASPNYLWGAMVMESLGGNALKMAVFQFGSLFRSNAAMAAISGVHTISAGLFMVFQVTYERGVAWETICWSFSAVAALILVVTPFLPRYHIPYHDHRDKEEDGNDKPEEGKATSGEAFNSSVFSVSFILMSFWFVENILAIMLFITYFNSWTSKFSLTNEEASSYSRVFGYANILSVVVTPLPGLVIDALANTLQRGKTGVMVKVASVQSMVLPMTVITIVSAVQMSTLLFHSATAVYVGLTCFTVTRASSFALSSLFLKIRFPAEHFNRLAGINGTATALILLVQYPHFLWAQSHYTVAIGTTAGAMLLGLITPIHLLNKSYLSRVLHPYTKLAKV